MIARLRGSDSPMWEDNSWMTARLRGSDSPMWEYNSWMTARLRGSGGLIPGMFPPPQLSTIKISGSLHQALVKEKSKKRLSVFSSLSTEMDVTSKLELTGKAFFCFSPDSRFRR
eukprot:2679156-Pyramimonas_sp.AAC.1